LCTRPQHFSGSSNATTCESLQRIDDTGVAMVGTWTASKWPWGTLWPRPRGRRPRPCYRELPRILLPRTRVNKGIKKEIGTIASSPDSPTHLGYYGHFFNPPGEVSLFCPAGHLPEALVSGLPLPLPSSIAANATPDTDILSAIISAAINNEMRFLISSHLLSLLANAKTGLPLSLR
jgi:hypothetical protein